MNEEQKNNYHEKMREELIKFSKRQLLPALLVEMEPKTVIPECAKNIETVYLKLGFIIKKRLSRGMFEAVLPKGWYKHIPDDSLNWFYILDNKNRERASVFYKKTVQGLESGHIVFMPRHYIIIDHAVPYNPFKDNNEEHFNSHIILFIKDGVRSKAAWMFDKKIKLQNKWERNSDNKLYYEEERKVRLSLYSIGKQVLNEKFPEHNNIFKYWD